MDKWKKVKLGKIINIFDSQRIPLSKIDRDKKKKLYPYYGAANLTDYVDDYIFDGEYILIGEDGTVVTSEGTPIIQYVKGKFWVNNHAHVITSNSKANNKFLYYILHCIQINDFVTGSVQPKFNQNNLKNLEISLPPLEIQNKIAKILSTIDEKIEINNEINEKLEEMAKLLYNEWFVEFNFPNEEGKPYKLSGGEMVESELGMIPKGWEVDSLTNLNEFKQGPYVEDSKRVKKGYPMYSGSSIIGFLSNYMYEEEVITLVCRGNGAGNITLSPKKTNITNSSFAIIAIENYKYYSYYSLLNFPFYKFKTGSGQPQITFNSLKSIKLVKPNEKLIKIFNKNIENNYKNILSNKEENQKLKETRDLLLYKLMNNEIDLSEMEIVYE